MLNKIILTAITLVSLSNMPASAGDYIDDMVAKAQKSVVSAQARLDKALLCQKDKPTCLTGLRQAAQKSADRAAAKLAAIN